MTPPSERRRDALAVLALLGGVIAALSFGHGRPVTTTFVVGAMAASTWRVWHRRDDVVLGITGVVLGPLTEWAATASGLWRYSSPTIGGLPLWVVPMWWIYPVAVARLIGALLARPPRAGHLTVCASMIALEVPWLCAFGARRPGLALAGTVVLLSVFLWRHHEPADWVTLAVCGAIGPAAELVPVRLGAWSYPEGPLFGLPLWLPSGYGLFGMALIQLGTALARPTGRALVDAGITRAAEQAVDTLRHVHDAEAEQRVTRR